MTALPLDLAELTIDVLGVPVPQGSKIGRVLPNGRVSMREANKALPKWREAIVTAAQARIALTGWVTLDGPVSLETWCYLPRPKSEPTRLYPHVKPDWDKLGRAISDAMTIAAVIVDDARIVDGVVHKRYAHAVTGARIIVRSVA